MGKNDYFIYSIIKNSRGLPFGLLWLLPNNTLINTFLGNSPLAGRKIFYLRVCKLGIMLFCLNKCFRFIMALFDIKVFLLV